MKQEVFPGLEQIKKTLRYELEGCECKEKCETANGCKCLRFGVNNYSSTGQLLLAEDSNLPILECHPNCSCSSECGNRSAQFSLQFKVEPFQTADKGLGLRAKEPIQKNHFLIEYSGQIVSEEKASKRAKQRSDEDPNQHNYIFTLNEYTGNSDNCTQTFIDATRHGNLSRLINHSCDPNLFPVILRYGRSLPVLALFTKRDIQTGEEFSYDYGKMSNLTEETKRAKPCRCGSQQCRGILPCYDYSCE
ncbi:hypothetical protein M3Y97_00686100 [Aphelenchoides bicaudatus]|nr:hypothetical protein M3Y97_00686100 [Aphelenchoides bicaudatus]